jgi:hypothetical protein
VHYTIDSQNVNSYLQGDGITALCWSPKPCDLGSNPSLFATITNNMHIINYDNPPPIEDLRLSNLSKGKMDNGRWTWEKKYAVVAVYSECGSLRETAERTGVTAATIENWRKLPWWEQMLREIRETYDAKLDNKLSKLITKALGVIEDRLDKGDLVLNQKTGEMVHRPLSARDATTAAGMLIDKQDRLRKNTVENIVAQASVQDTLKMLAAEFAKLSGQVRQPTVQLEEVEEVEYKDIPTDSPS